MLVAKLKEIIKLQKTYWYSLTNLRLIQWARSNDHSETDDKALHYITYSQRVGFDTFLSSFKWLTFWHQGLTPAVFWPTTFIACMVRGVIRTYTGLQPSVAGKSYLEVSETLRRQYLGQNESDCDDDLCVSSSWCSWGAHQIAAH